MNESTPLNTKTTTIPSYALFISSELSSSNSIDDGSDLSTTTPNDNEHGSGSQQFFTDRSSSYSSIAAGDASSCKGYVTCCSIHSDYQDDLSESVEYESISNNEYYEQHKQHQQHQQRQQIDNAGTFDENLESDSIKSLEKHLTLFDLISIGVAATVGSGIFVLCGFIAHDFAGPSTFLCWIIAGLSCCASGLCYAELSSKFCVSGSSYSYAVSNLIVQYVCNHDPFEKIL